MKSDKSKWKRKKIKKELKTEQLILRIEPSLKNDLLALAQAKGISYSEAIRQMIIEQIIFEKAIEVKGGM